ncbi:hypothetical protein DBR11_23975 [Pedobacter sp. HMWF019]|uniref:hypothetical protein n=1 Tax=Pedobacter sp. HMWF019 TaxID=2056856 RepID=UPI000D3C1A77|nr:hypothetical protein [Pedobacter sp. HMWF019]PTS94166.1 hypothetical protein DBR11_23975 [Pedobacter sp. HMWF019]
MMANKLITVQLVLTIILASQGIFYLMGAAQAYQKLSLHAFSEQRLVLDNVIAIRLKLLYGIALLLGLAVLIGLRKTPLSSMFIGVSAATLFLLADVIIALVINIPINKAFANLAISDIGRGARLQASWLQAVLFRGILSTLALITLLISWANR